MPLGRLADIGLLIDQHQSHQPHLAADTLDVDHMSSGTKVSCHMLHAIKRCFQKLLIDELNERKIVRALTLTGIIHRRA